MKHIYAVEDSAFDRFLARFYASASAAEADCKEENEQTAPLVFCSVEVYDIDFVPSAGMEIFVVREESNGLDFPVAVFSSSKKAEQYAAANDYYYVERAHIEAA